MTETNNDDAWFAAKRFGYGASLPITWQGWALTGGYIAVLFGLGLLAVLPNKTGQVIALVLFILATGAFVALSRHHTRGGWKWRWGNTD